MYPRALDICVIWEPTTQRWWAQLSSAWRCLGGKPMGSIEGPWLNWVAPGAA